MGKTYNIEEFKLGDLVYYHDTYVIPPDAVNWKLTPDPALAAGDRLAIIVDEDVGQWDKKPHGRHRLYRIIYVKTGHTRTCSAYNLTKAYINDEIEK